MFLIRISPASIARLQLVQKAANRFLTSTSKREHITSILTSLYWLAVCLQIHLTFLFLFFFACLFVLFLWFYVLQIGTICGCSSKTVESFAIAHETCSFIFKSFLKTLFYFLTFDLVSFVDYEFYVPLLCAFIITFYSLYASLELLLSGLFLSYRFGFVVWSDLFFFKCFIKKVI